RRIEGSRTPGQADDLVVPVADGVQVVDLEDDVVEQRHGRSPHLVRSRSAAAASRGAVTASLANCERWLAIAWAVSLGLMDLTRMSACGGMGIGDGAGGRRVVGGAAIRPACRGATARAQVSDQSADDLVDGLGLAGLLVEPRAAADQSTADDGT